MKEGRTKVNQLRFEAGLGHYSVSVATDSVWIFSQCGLSKAASAVDPCKNRYSVIRVRLERGR
jgi:hypothetical protein